MSERTSQTDWRRIEAMPDEDMDLSDIPEITEEQIARARLRVGGKPVPRAGNRLTRETLRKSARNEEIYRPANADEMFRELGI